MKNRMTTKFRHGLTLIELMIVIGIIAIVSAAAIPLVRSLTADREIREATRMLTTFIERARADAISEGTSSGIYFERDPRDPNKCIDVYMLKFFPTYAGDVENSTCYFQRGTGVHTLFMTRSQNLLVAANKISAGDEIRFGNRGACCHGFD